MTTKCIEKAQRFLSSISSSPWLWIGSEKLCVAKLVSLTRKAIYTQNLTAHWAAERSEEVKKIASRAKDLMSSDPIICALNFIALFISFFYCSQCHRSAKMKPIGSSNNIQLNNSIIFHRAALNLSQISAKSLQWVMAVASELCNNVQLSSLEKYLFTFCNEKL